MPFWRRNGGGMSKPVITIHSVTAFLAREFGDVTSLVQLVEGEESRAFGFTLDAQKYVLRVNRSMEDFRKDAFAAQSFGSLEVPIPEIIRIGAFDDVHSFCVSRRAPGLTLQDLLEANLPASLKPVAQVLEAISRSDISLLERCGHFGSDGIGTHQTWKSYVLAITRRDEYDWSIVSARPMMQQILPLLDELERCAEHCPERRGLVHGDFGSNNVLIDKQRVAAVIDWSEALIGDPIYDVANLFFWRTWLPCMEYQARYYEHRNPSFLHAPSFRSYQLRIGLDQLYQSLRDQENQDAAWALARCEELVAHAD